MTYKFAIAIAVVLASIGTSGCKKKGGGPIVTPPDNPPQPDPHKVVDAIDEKLKESEFKVYDGPFEGRVPAPGISSYRQDPINALGSIFAKVAKSGATCSSTNADDFEFVRLVEQRPETCQSKAYPASTVAQMLVDGKTAASIEYIVGKTGVSAEYAYEFIVSEPITAVLVDTSKCLVSTQIQALRLPARTCDLKYIAGVVVTQVSYRQYRKLAVQGDASYVVKVAGEAYGSAEQLTNKWYMTVDPLDLTRFFTSNDSGFLQNRTTALPPAEVKDLPKVKPDPETDRVILEWNEKRGAPDIQLEVP